MATPTWIPQVLRAIGAPINSNTITAMEDWGAAEGGSGNNWLNTKEATASAIPSGDTMGFPGYGSVPAGVQAVVATLNQSNMAPIKAALRAGESVNAIKQAIIASPWDQNHYSGTDFAKGVPIVATLTSATLPGGGLTGAGAAKPKAGTAAPVTSAPNLSAGATGAGGAATPTNQPGLFGLTSTDENTPLEGNNGDILGPTKAGTTRTLGDAVSDLSKMDPTQIAHLQAALYASGHLSSPHWGVLDSETVDAFVTVAKSAIVNKVSISTQLNNAMEAGPLAIGGPASTPANVSIALPDPAEAAVDLQTAFGNYGLGSPTAAQQKAYYSQLEAAYSAKASGSSTVADAQTKAAQRQAIAGLATSLIPVGTTPTAAQTKAAQDLVDKLGSNVGAVNTLVTTDVNPTDDAALFAQGVAAKTPGAQTHVEASTEADITKEAAAMGVQLSPVQMKNITAQVDANTKVTGAPDANLVSQLVAKQFKMPTDPSNLSGDAATVYNDLSKLAGQYLFKATPALLSSWVTKAIQNQSYAGSLTGDTEAEFEDYLRQQMGVQMPWLSQATQGFQTMNPWTATSSYRTQISNILGLGDPDSVDLTGKYANLLKAPDGKNPPTMQDITTQILNDPQYGYDSSPNGIARGYNVGIAVAKNLGINLAGV